jgi:hydrogenase maturation protease
VTKTLVLGLGSRLRGDDGLGPAVVDWLNQQPLPPDVTALDGGTPGLELALTLADYPRAVIVDAAELHRAPGQWARLERHQLAAANTAAGLHAAGLAEALALGSELGTLPAELVIYGVQPAQVDWSPDLSPQAQAAVPRVGQAVLEELWPKS